MMEREDLPLLIAELERNLWEAWSTFGRGPGCTLHAHGDVVWFETPLPIIPYNGVLRFQAREHALTKVSEIVGHFQHRNVPFMWILHPSSQPPELPHILADQGLKDVEPIYGMVRSLSHLPEVPPPAPEVEIRKVAGERDAGAFHQFAAWRWNIPEQHNAVYAAVVSPFRFGLPGSWAHMWQAWREGSPIAKAGLYLASGSAGIYAVVTRPEARRLGLARILTLTALQYARQAGYGLAVLHSTPMAEGLYKSIGFATHAEFRLFATTEVHI